MNGGRSIRMLGSQMRRLSTTCARRETAALATASGAVSPTPSQRLLTLRELDRLLTSVADSSSQNAAHPSPLAMRAHRIPWLSSNSPNLASSSKQSVPRMSDQELADMLRPKHMSESFTSFDLPLASDPKLYELYVNTSGGFRMGKILEHLDSLAGAVAYRHCLPLPSERSTAETATDAFHEASARAGLYLATASADRLDMFGRLNRDNVRDLRFSGFVTWTGNSSMEVVIKMEGSHPHQPGHMDTLMLGRFAMVCRDSATQKARKIPPLIVETEDEKLLWQIGAEHTQRKRESSRNALDKVPPSSDEAKELHELMLSVRDNKMATIDGQEVVQMKDTEMESVQLMFPQDRNLHGKVFGGILMRLAFELCFTNAALFASEPMRFLSLDEITFRLPVPIGAVLRLSSKVVHTTMPHDGPDGEAKAHIMVRAEVEEVDTGVSTPMEKGLDTGPDKQIRRETNTFFFTMAMEGSKPLGRTVIPTTYVEAMHYLEGKRRLEVGDEMRRLYQGSVTHPLD